MPATACAGEGRRVASAAQMTKKMPPAAGLEPRGRSDGGRDPRAPAAARGPAHRRPRAAVLQDPPRRLRARRPLSRHPRAGAAQGRARVPRRAASGGARAAALAVARGAARRAVHSRRALRSRHGGRHGSASTSSTSKHVPKHVNNWDLVDSSAHLIVGAHLEERDRGVLYELARSPHLWSRRVAIIATFWFIKRGSFDDTLAIAELLARRPRGSHPQGHRLDAARGRQSRPRRRRALLAAPLPAHAAHDVALRDREVSRRRRAAPISPAPSHARG